MSQYAHPKLKVKEESEKIFSIQKTMIMASGPITSWQIDGKTIESERLYFLGLQNHCRDITLLTKVHLVKAMVFPVVMYGVRVGL